MAERRTSDVEHLTLVEEHVAPPRPAMQYARLGFRTAALAWVALPWRMARFVVALPLTLAVPVLLAAFLADARGFDLQAWVNGAAQPISRDVIVSALPVFSVLSGLFGHVVLKATFDAALFAGIRRAACPGRSAGATEIVRLLPGYLGLAMLEVGLLVGSLMFLTPGFRVVFRVLGEPDAPAGTFWFTAILLFASMLLLALARFWNAIAAAFLVWRPRFVAATLVAAVWMPVRQWRTFGPAALMFAAGYLALNATTALLIERGLFGGYDWPVAIWFVLVLLQLALMSWLDAVLVGLVGQRLGDIEVDVGAGVWKRPVASAVTAQRPQLPFDPPLPGLYTRPNGPFVPVSFNELRRFRRASPSDKTMNAAPTE